MLLLVFSIYVRYLLSLLNIRFLHFKYLCMIAPLIMLTGRLVGTTSKDVT